MHWPRWFRLTTDDSVPKYQHIASSEFAFDNASTHWKRRFYVLGSVYIVTVFIFIAGFLFKSSSITEGYETLRTDAVFGTIPREQILFTPNQTYRDIFRDSSVSELENLTLWDALQPRGGGFIIIPDPQKYGLSGGLPLEDEDDGIVREGYGISMFHQIHCLVAIRTAFRTKNFDNDHLNHCFEYLRQSIMCTGDTTLEKVVVDENGVFKPDIDGWGTEHECKSWNMLYEYAESRRAKVIGDL
ncbi:hypothetical protein A0O28_0032400 [Trichoderma guizhouense]|uniref:Oxidase ustYa n=1 Tax=Trichoderma guizhouense TaxID=1491466 RepID=A0A1T3CM09_9HYPO|nr:hypothetical protein A0O28_0032400 [Trichoderma guizhouense]